jgi:hypothetical protein
MGHYASEMDSNWGNPSPSEVNLSGIEDERIRNLARELFRGFDSSPHLNSTNSSTGIRVAEAIDELIKARLDEMIGSASPTD